MSNWRSKCSSVISASGAMPKIAAPLTRMSGAPTLSITALPIASIEASLLTSTATALRPSPIARAVCRRLLGKEVGDHHARPFRHVALADRAADAARPARHHRHLVLQPHRFLPYTRPD